jgi:hypothetical protein
MDIEHKVIFSTGKVYEFDMARNLLSDSNIPFHTQEDSFSGLRLATPSTPVAGPGIWYSILVPEQSFADAQNILSELPFEIGTEPDFWHFGTGSKIKFGYRIYALILLALALLFLFLYIKDLLK